MATTSPFHDLGRRIKPVNQNRDHYPAGRWRLLVEGLRSPALAIAGL
jgi:hypothetical protein